MNSISRRWKLLALAFAALALLLGACGGDDDDTAASDGVASERVSDDFDDGAGDDGASEPEPASESGGAGQVVTTEAQDASAEEPADDSDAGGGGGDGGSGEDSVDTPRPDIGRSIIFIATVEVVVDDVTLSASLAKDRIAGLGGLVFGEETSVGKTTRTTLEFKVFPEDFDEALRRLEGLGELKAQTITADDVTERVVDLQSRISTASASVDRLRGFLEGATDLEAIAELELQLLSRETDLELLRGQLRTIRDQVDLATIFLTLTETAPPEVEPLGEYVVTYLEGNDAGTGCPGTDELTVDEGETFTVCVAITNVGSNPMVDIVVRDNPLDLDPRDFAFLDAAKAELLPVGETVIAHAATEAPASGSSRVKVSASAADIATGESLRIGIEFFEPEESSIRFIEDDSLPGFMDALTGSWAALVTVLSVALLILAALIPFLWIIPLIWIIRRLVLRWMSRRGKDASLPPPGPPPAPAPAPIAAAAGPGDAD